MQVWSMNLRKKQKIKSHWEDQRLLGTSVGGTLVLSQVGNAVICSHCHNTVPQTGWLNNRNLCLTVPEAGKSNIKVPFNLVPSESSLPGFQTAAFRLCTQMTALCMCRERGKERNIKLSGVSST